jgi:hypothetical protein
MVFAQQRLQSDGSLNQGLRVDIGRQAGVFEVYVHWLLLPPSLCAVGGDGNPKPRSLRFGLPVH